jgi:2-alkenal reductase
MGRSIRRTDPSQETPTAMTDQPLDGPRPDDAPTAPIAPRPAETEPSSYSPAPDAPTEWQRQNWPAPERPTPETWFEPSVPPAPPAAKLGRSRATVGIGTLLAVSVLTAGLASGGTYLAIRASGSADRTVATIAPAGQPTGAANPVTIDESSAIVNVAQKVSPAVVQIVTGSAPSQTDPLAQQGVGSGVIFDRNGWILTNRHVVTGATKLTVQLKDGREFDGTVYGIDTLTDLAIVKIEATDLPTATIGDSSELKVGQLAIAIGSPLGTYSNSVTSGIVSAMGRSIQVDGGPINNLIQTDTAINPGNSGGPLLDALGNVIGINTAIAKNAEGIGFAIPINIARPIMQQAIAGQQLARPWIGVRYAAIDLQLQKQKNLPVSAGALIGPGIDANGQTTVGIVAGSPAAKAGLKDGDIITAVEGQAIDGDHPLDAVLSQFAPGRTVTLGILRDGQKLELQLLLGTRPTNL